MIVEGYVLMALGITVAWWLATMTWDYTGPVGEEVDKDE